MLLWNECGNIITVYFIAHVEFAIFLAFKYIYDAYYYSDRYVPLPEINKLPLTILNSTTVAKEMTFGSYRIQCAIFF